MKNLKLKYFLSVILFFVTEVAFSRDDVKYSYINTKEMTCNLSLTKDGAKVSKELNMGIISPKGEGICCEANGVQCYEIGTDICHLAFDKPAPKIKIQIYDCNKSSGLKASDFILSQQNQTEVPIIKAKVPAIKYKDWGPMPDELNDGPTPQWTMTHGMCEGSQSENIKASTTLAQQGKYKYLASYVCDDDPTTAWVEGNIDYGIGEFLEFKGFVPMGNGEISILNGYQSSKTAWENNSRVKKFKISLNGKDICILELGDVMGVQTFNLPPNEFKNLRDESILRFTILEVFPGLKYKDTAISGIFSCGG